VARADLAAQKVLEMYGCHKPPVNPEEIAQELLGAIVVKSPMAADVSGMLVREPGRVVIGVNGGHAGTRQRFTIAHEVGHLQLHKGRALIMDTDVRVNFRDGTSSLATDREEIEANRFAAAMLMPDPMVRSEISRAVFDTAPQLVGILAGRFLVSEAAMNFRLVNLGIIPTPVDLGQE
jgi:Zn-dependent peptidase ImmA (M78 family)